MRRLALAAVVAVVTGLSVAAATSAVADAAEIRVVTVVQDGSGGPASVVAEIRPAPTGTLPADAAVVTVDGNVVPATTASLLAPGGRTAVVVDASDAGAAALPQALSGAAAFLLRLPAQAQVTVTADGSPPRGVTSGPVDAATAIHDLTTIKAGGVRSTAQALETALRGLPSAGAPRSLVLLETTGPPPQDPAGTEQLKQRLTASGAVLAVVTTTGAAQAWGQIADATGGLAVGAAAGNAAGAFDDVARVLGARSVVTFTPPGGAPSAVLRLRSGGDVLTVDVALPSAATSPAASGAAGSPGSDRAPRETTGESRWAAAVVPVVVVAVVLALVVCLVAFLVRRRRPSGSAEIPAEIPAEAPAVPPPAEEPPHEDVHAGAPAGAGHPPGEVPRGVRMFDVSDPAIPVEIDRDAHDRGTRYVGRHRRGHPAQLDDDDAEEPHRQDYSA